MSIYRSQSAEAIPISESKDLPVAIIGAARHDFLMKK